VIKTKKNCLNCKKELDQYDEIVNGLGFDDVFLREYNELPFCIKCLFLKHFSFLNYIKIKKRLVLGTGRFFIKKQIEAAVERIKEYKKDFPPSKKDYEEVIKQAEMISNERKSLKYKN